MIVTHCEDTPSIKVLEDEARAKVGRRRAHARASPHPQRGRLQNPPAWRSPWPSSGGAGPHVLHSDHGETRSHSFTATPDLKDPDKNITAEVCVHHLFFNEADYDTLGSQISATRR